MSNVYARPDYRNKEYKDPNNLCIFMSDANESINDKSGKIQKLLAEKTLVDTFALIAVYPGKMPTYTRGTKRIEYIFPSNALVQIS
jgi:hypothetical protein